MKFAGSAGKALFGAVKRLLGATTANSLGVAVLLGLGVFALWQLGRFIMSNELLVLACLIGAIILPLLVWGVVKAAGQLDSLLANETHKLKELRERNEWKHLL